MPEGEPEDARVKDRISYSNSVCQTDLTWVKIPVSLYLVVATCYH
jgi:hypothetical protein